jgi:TonB dependent receptor/CarboxypepD_reg-like domain/TonB-dependent Receptor Plug Domain
MGKIILFLIFLFCGKTVFSQHKFTISGTIKSKKKGETLIGATVLSANIGTVTNDYGFYSLTLPDGLQTVEFSNVGMQTQTFQIVLTKNMTINLSLEDTQKDLGQVIITAAPTSRRLSSPQMGIDKLSTGDIKDIPMLFGERDVLKALQLLPGIKSAGDGITGFYVRGGSADQNLILLDEAPVYNASHLLGFFSTFNSDAIKDVTIYKAGMPAQYGGRLSSVLDIKMNDGNNQNYNVSGGIGTVSSQLNVEGPLQKDKSSFLISARRTYADLFLKLSSDSSVRNNSLYFYDLNAKLNYQLGNYDRLYLSGYFGADKLGLGGLYSLQWGNGTGTLRWNHIFTNRLFSNTSLIFSNYNYHINQQNGANNVTLFSQIRDWNIKEELQWYFNEKHSFRMGVNSIFHTMRPDDITGSQGSNINSQVFQKRYSWENAVYFSDVWKTSDKLNLSFGLRFSAFSILGPGDFYVLDNMGNVTDTLHYNTGQFVKTYFNPEPRLAVSYVLNKVSSIKLSYVRNVQYLHLISNSTTSNPTDKWIASTNIIKPELSDQLSVGYYRNLAENKYEMTVETYYKILQNQIDYRDGANVFTNGAIESQLLFGRGRAYGIEWLLKRKVGRLTGWISYTLSKVEEKIDGINENNWYSARQDRTHDIAVVAVYQMNKKWSFSANWVFYTGDAVSFPSGKYTVGGEVYFYYAERNGYRMPDYHRLDLGVTVQLKNKKHFSSELSFSLYNAYGRQNASTITFRQNKDDPSKTEAVQTALFTYVPSITYNFKFK